MTDLLYMTDAYLRDFEATVTAVNGQEVILDRTAFTRAVEDNPTTWDG